MAMINNASTGTVDHKWMLVESTPPLAAFKVCQTCGFSFTLSNPPFAISGCPGPDQGEERVVGVMQKDPSIR